MYTVTTIVYIKVSFGWYTTLYRQFGHYEYLHVIKLHIHVIKVLTIQTTHFI